MNSAQRRTAIDTLVSALGPLAADQQASVLSALQPEIAAAVSKQLQVPRDTDQSGADRSGMPTETGDKWATVSFESPKAATNQSPAVDLAGDSPPVARVGRYEIRSELGRGGFGVVYLAYDNELKRLVALKTPHRQLVHGSGDVDTFLAEARILAGLDHPNIVPVYDAGRTDDGGCYLVSKYVEGLDLGSLIRRGLPSHGQAVKIVAGIAQALHCAHKEGLVHRDVKPSNILLDSNGVPHLADFGLALDYAFISREARSVGTPTYMSPEQATGGASQVDGRSDIFSLGVVLYELLTGQRPFPATDLDELVAQIVHLEPRPLRQIDDLIPKRLEAICLKCLSKSLRDRYTTAIDLCEDLMTVATYEPRPINVSSITLPDSLNDLIETLARSNHDVWAQGRIQEGWQYGDVRDDQRKTHPDLVPYEQLTESEKEYDRQTVVMTVKAILASGYLISHRGPAGSGGESVTSEHS